MTKLRWSILLTAFLILAVPAASASLPAFSYGFPTMIQSVDNIGFNQAVGSAWDLESLNFSPFGTPGCAFPVVQQSGVQGQSLVATEFAQSTVFSAFSYPAVDTGLGFAGFGLMDSFGFLD